MKRRTVITSVLILVVATLGWSRPVSAGGWALVELVVPITDVVARNQVDVDVYLLQHGLRPFDGASLTLTATHRATGTKISTDSEPIADLAGGYRFKVTFPAAGEWKWYINQDPFPGMTAFPTLNVSGGLGTPEMLKVEDTATTITIKNMTFTPATVEISAGTTVKWVNEDLISHQVSSLTAIWFDDSPMLQPGESYEFTFETPDTLDYVCGPHAGMNGSITIV